MAETVEISKGKKFARGLKDEFLGMACRDGVEAFNIENFIFGTIGHIGIGFAAASGVMAAANKKGKGLISGLFKGKKA